MLYPLSYEGPAVEVGSSSPPVDRCESSEQETRDPSRWLGLAVGLPHGDVRLIR